jgi:methyl-accepting chemotaxis protein
MYQLDTLEAMRRNSARLIVIGLWAHLPVLALIAAVNGTLGWSVESLAVATAIAATLAWRLTGHGPAARQAIGLASIVMAFLLVIRAAGPWQVDTHLYLFAVLALLALFSDWRVLVVATGAAVVVQLVLAAVAPSLLFPDGASAGRLVVHGLFIAFECGILIRVVWRLTDALERAGGAVQAAAVAQRDAEGLADAERDRAAREGAARERMASDAQRFDQAIRQSLKNVDNATDDVLRLVADLHGMATELDAVARDMVATMTESAHEMGAANQASSGISASIEDIGQKVAQSSSIARDAVRQAHRTNETVEGLSEAARRIGDVVKLINDIASQTNLLALNATIEAARAGDAGKGFAVVAGEVKSLANQTAKATDEISAQISAMQAATGSAVEAIRGISGTITDIDGLTAGVVAAIGAQSASTQQITGRIEKASEGARRITASCDRVAGAMQRTVETVARISDQVRLAGETSDAVQIQVEDFLRTMGHG